MGFKKIDYLNINKSSIKKKYKNELCDNMHLIEVFFPAIIEH